MEVYALLLALACGEAPAVDASPDEDASTSDSPSEQTPPLEPPDRAPADGGEPEPPEPTPPDLGPVPPLDPRRPSPQRFVDVTVEAGLDLDPGPLQIPPFCLLSDPFDLPGQGSYCIPERFLGAAAVGDYDGDGWPDVYLSRMDGPGRLMHNQGDGTFEDRAEEAGLTLDEPFGGAAWLDVEGDGDLDLMLTSFGGERHRLYVNDGSGHFSEEGRDRGVALMTGDVHVGMSIAVGDYDRDGYVDMFVADWRNSIVLGPGQEHNRLLRNLGAAAPGYFEDVTGAAGIDLAAVTLETAGVPGAFGFSPAFVDLDDDGWPDLALVADFGTSRLLWNDGAGGFVDGTEAAGIGTETNGMGSTFGDLDHDGDLDWFVSSIWAPGTVDDGNRLYRNEGDRTFVDVTDAFGVREGGWGWGTALFDVELDGDLDLVLAAGWPSTPFSRDPVRLWLDEGELPWPEVAAARGLELRGQGRGLVPFDYDRDGDLDLLVATNTEIPALYRNDVEGSWLEVRAAGAGGNPLGLGARVRVQAEPGGAWQVRQIGVGGHYLGQAEAVAHFGLPPGAGPVHRVEITWPGAERAVILRDVDRDQRLELVQ